MTPGELTTEFERIADAAALGRDAPAKRMLVIVNPYATTMSDRLKGLVIYALQGRYEVEAIDTQRKGHATELCREAAREGYDVVVAFGGDGTVNEVVNGLAGTDTPLSVLPGGATNVYVRMLGIPNDVVDATEHLLALADTWAPRAIDVARVNERWFSFSAGAGLDASVVERVDRHPKLKARFGEYFFTYAALASFNRNYLVRPPRLRVEVAGRSLEGVTVVVQNADPFTYFGKRPIRIAEGAAMDDGTLSAAVLKRATPFQMPTLIPRIFAASSAAVLGHRQIEGFSDLDAIRVERAGDAPLPVEVDGDYMGEFDEVQYGIAPLSLAVVA
jgi:diacylglycerol kinase family enzyme